MDPKNPPVRLLFVCLGNICRSPTAEAVMRHVVAEAGLDGRIEVDSAGTSAAHAGERPDRRSAAEAARRGIPLTGRSRPVRSEDYHDADLLLAMDRRNLDTLLRNAPPGADPSRVRLLRTFDLEAPPWPEVPDPYAGGPDGFAHVFDLVDAACRGLLDELLRTVPALAPEASA